LATALLLRSYHVFLFAYGSTQSSSLTYWPLASQSVLTRPQKKINSDVIQRIPMFTGRLTCTLIAHWTMALASQYTDNNRSLDLEIPKFEFYNGLLSWGRKRDKSGPLLNI
jgi:hypothetical protein